MRFLSSLLIADPVLLAQRLAVATVIRALLWAFLFWDPLAAFWALWPNPVTPLVHAFTWIDWSVLGWNVYHLADLVLILTQLSCLPGLTVWAIGRFQPDVLEKVPALALPDRTKPLDGKGLRRWSLTTPLLLTLIVFVTFYGIGALVLSGSGTAYRPGGTPYQMLGQVGVWPLYAGGLFALVGWFGGFQRLSGAQGIAEEDFAVQWLSPEHALTKRVHHYSAQLDLPPPRVGVMNAVNAFAMGRSPKDACVVLGVPLIKHLQPDELDAVIGHELGHIVSGDMVQMEYSDGFKEAFVFMINYLMHMVTVAAMSMARMQNSKIGEELSYRISRGVGFIFSRIGNFGGVLLVQGLSRSREFYADAIGAGLTSPDAMQRALAKLHEIPADATEPEDKYAYMMFRPLSLGYFLATHPPTERRIASLQRGAYTRRLPRKGG